MFNSLISTCAGVTLISISGLPLLSRRWFFLANEMFPDWIWIKLYSTGNVGIATPRRLRRLLLDGFWISFTNFLGWQHREITERAHTPAFLFPAKGRKRR